ncbi:MAG: YbaB/EbfC family nucleoid-associated protein [Sulfurovum sp.]|nr:YbaB/EbfC family nucleoid-associated protein [Sulfurovum sp.]
MFEGIDLNNMGKMMEQMQEKATQMQEQSKSIQLTAKGGGGMIEVTTNGMGEVIDITVDDSLLLDKESLQILLISTMNDAMKMVEDNKKSQAMGMFGGMNPFGGST